MLKKQLKEHEENEAVGKRFLEKKIQLEEKEEEIQKLEAQIIGSTKEIKNLNGELSRSIDDLLSLKTQLEEYKITQEALKGLLNEKEVVELRMKIEKSNPHLNLKNKS